MISYGGIPFELKVDPFYSKENQDHLREAISDYESGKSKVITKTLEDLEGMED